MSPHAAPINSVEQMEHSATDLLGAVGGANANKPIMEQPSVNRNKQLIIKDVELEWMSPPYNDYCEIMEPIFALQPIEHVDERAINQILVTIVGAAENAREKGYTIERDQILIVALLHRILDVTSQSLWSWHIEGQEPTLSAFIGFLTKRAKRITPKELPSWASMMESNSRASSFVSAGASSTSHVVVPSTSNGTTTSGAMAKKVKTVCVRCQGEHFLHRCPQFRTLTIPAKRATLNQARLCHNCFSATHATSDCKKGVCKRCNSKHNSILCPKVDSGDWKDE